MSNLPPASTSKSRRADSSAPRSDKAARAAAFQFLSHLAAELTKGSVNLPCFPDIVLRVRKALSDPENTPDMTVLIVGAEPARLLQIANSAVFNPAGKPLTDLRTAVTRLGTHPSIGKAVLENWGFVGEIVDAVGSQSDYDRVSKRAADLTDILIAAIGLAAVPRGCASPCIGALTSLRAPAHPRSPR